MLLSNRRRDAFRAKYELQHTVRTHLGGNDQAYKCIFQCEDENGTVGVRLSKELMAVAGEWCPGAATQIWVHRDSHTWGRLYA